MMNISRAICVCLIGLLVGHEAVDGRPNDSYEAVYKECMQMPDFRADDMALNVAYKKLMKALSPAKAAELKKAQLEWISVCRKMVKDEGRPHKNLELSTQARKEALEEMVAALERKK